MTKLLPGWFPELTPDKQGLENELRDIIKTIYKKYWYINIETPSIETNEILTSKWWDEVSKQIFWLYWLSQWNEDLKDYSLHFDLTVPLARYVVEHEQDIKFPFKRFAMQKVFRWERQQKWRFKEFMQCDVDVIDENLDLNYDTEVIETLYKTIDSMFNHLWINKWLELHLNNRKFIDLICKNFSIEWEKIKDFYKVLDDFYKLTNKEFKDNLNSIVGVEKSWKIIEIFETDILDLSFESDEMNSSVDEIKNVYSWLKQSWVNVKFDPYITRWLDYYTWTVFETFVTDYFWFWSICSWGRYDNLVWDIRSTTGIKWKNYWWVWWSIWLTRLFSRLLDTDLVNKRSVLVETIIFNIPWISDEYRKKISNLLREWWITTDVYYKEDKLWKQFSYAENKNIPFWIFAWEDEEKESKVVLKNLDSRESYEIDLDNLLKEIKEKLKEIIY